MFLTDLPATNSVRFGFLYHKTAGLTEFLSKSVRLVAHETRFEEESFLGMTGSCTLISYRGVAYVVTTRHQLAVAPGTTPTDDRLHSLRFATGENGLMKNIPVNLVIHETSNPDQEYHDLLFFRVEPSWLEHSADRAFFMHLEEFYQGPRLISFFYGHPLMKNEVQYEPLHAFIRVAHVDGKLDETFKSHSDYLRRYEVTKTEYDVNGFSGGAAFSLIDDVGGGWRVLFDGVIVRGGTGSFYVVTTDYLLRALDEISDVGGN